MTLKIQSVSLRFTHNASHTSRRSQRLLRVSSCPGEDDELLRAEMNSDPFAEIGSKADPFGPEPPARPQLNGRESSSPEMFDLSRLAPPLSAPSNRVCRTPEAFLGPTGASLVNLDALIPPNPPSKSHKNPFLSGNSAISLGIKKNKKKQKKTEIELNSSPFSLICLNTDLVRGIRGVRGSASWETVPAGRLS